MYTSSSFHPPPRRDDETQGRSDFDVQRKKSPRQERRREKPQRSPPTILEPLTQTLSVLTQTLPTTDPESDLPSPFHPPRGPPIGFCAQPSSLLFRRRPGLRTPAHEEGETLLRVTGDHPHPSESPHETLTWVSYSRGSQGPRSEPPPPLGPSS